jgi:hypothetical protein
LFSNKSKKKEEVHNEVRESTSKYEISTDRRNKLKANKNRMKLHSPIFRALPVCCMKELKSQTEETIVKPTMAMAPAPT